MTSITPNVKYTQATFEIGITPVQPSISKLQVGEKTRITTVENSGVLFALCYISGLVCLRFTSAELTRSGEQYSQVFSKKGVIELSDWLKNLAERM